MRNGLFCLLTLLLCSVSVTEAKVYKVEDVPMVHLADRTRYVSNPDGILSSASVATVDSLLYALEESTGIQVLVAVLGEIDGSDCFDFAHRLGKENGVGRKESDNGLVVLLSTGERCVQFATGYGLEGVMPDAICKRIQQQYMVEYFAAGDWDTGMVEGMRAVCGVLDGSMEPPADDDGEIEPVFIGLFAMLVCFVCVIFIAVIVWYVNRCPNCGKHNIQRIASQTIRGMDDYDVLETTYVCKHCGHTFKRRDRTLNNRRGPGGGVVIGGGFGGGYGRGGGFSGGHYGGGRFGGGGAGSRF